MMFEPDEESVLFPDKVITMRTPLSTEIVIKYIPRFIHRELFLTWLERIIYFLSTRKAADVLIPNGKSLLISHLRTKKENNIEGYGPLDGLIDFFEGLHITTDSIWPLFYGFFLTTDLINYADPGKRYAATLGNVFSGNSPNYEVNHASLSSNLGGDLLGRANWWAWTSIFAAALASGIAITALGIKKQQAYRLQFHYAEQDNAESKSKFFLKTFKTLNSIYLLSILVGDAKNVTELSNDDVENLFAYASYKSNQNLLSFIYANYRLMTIGKMPESRLHSAILQVLNYTIVMPFLFLARLHLWLLIIGKFSDLHSYHRDKAVCEEANNLYLYQSQIGNYLCQVCDWGMVSLKNTLSSDDCMKALMEKPRAVSDILFALNDFKTRQKNISFVDFSQQSLMAYSVSEFENLMELLKSISQNVTEIDFSQVVPYENFPTEFSSQLATLIEQLKPTSRLDFSGLEIGNFGYFNIAPIFKNIPANKYYLASTGLTDMASVLLGEYLQGNRSIVELDLSNNALSETGLNNILMMLHGQPEPLSLHLHNVILNNNSINVLAHCLNEIPISRLFIPATGLGMTNLTNLFQSISQSAYLSEIDISNNQLQYPELIKFFWVATNSSLLKIDVSRNVMQLFVIEQGFIKPWNPLPISINFSNMQIGDDLFCNLVAMLRGNYNNLDFSNNTFTTQSMSQCISFLATLQATGIDFSYNAVDGAVLPYLFELASNMMPLYHLGINGIGLNDSVGAEILYSLPFLQLTSLSMAENNFGPKTSKALTNPIFNSSQIQFLNLSYSNLTITAFNNILDSARHSKLTHCIFNGNNFSDPDGQSNGIWNLLNIDPVYEDQNLDSLNSVDASRYINSRRPATNLRNLQLNDCELNFKLLTSICRVKDAADLTLGLDGNIENPLVDFPGCVTPKMTVTPFFKQLERRSWENKQINESRNLLPQQLQKVVGFSLLLVEIDFAFIFLLILLCLCCRKAAKECDRSDTEIRELPRYT